MVVAAHTLLETYAVLTRLPPPYRLRPADALGLVEGVRDQCEVVALSAAETWSLLRKLPGGGIAGGSTYDALVAACARKGSADAIVTWNVRDFERVAEGLEVVSPRTA
jgi:predicted nucleic acid-binding protein